MGKEKILQFKPQRREHGCGSDAEHSVLDVSLGKSTVLIPWRRTLHADLLGERSTSLEGVPAEEALQEEVAQVRDEVAETIQRLSDLLEAYVRERRLSIKQYSGLQRTTRTQPVVPIKAEAE